MGAEEENAVRYASGYVSLKLMKTYMHSDSTKAAQFVECLSNMAVAGEESDFYQYTTEWLRSVDRGGLFHINDISFLFFRAIEVATQLHLPQHLQHPTQSSDFSIRTKITEAGDVQFYWAMLSVNIDDMHNSELLNAIVDLWVTIRGFTLTSSWLENYKRASGIKTKAKKGLRKALQSNEQ